MYQYYFTFRSVTAAMEGSVALEKLGIAAPPMRTPSALQQQGCGYCLRVRQSLWQQAHRQLQQEGILPGHVYRRQRGGPWEEVPL